MKPPDQQPPVALSPQLTDLLATTGARLAQEAADSIGRVVVRKRKGGLTLRPGAATPLWNALRAELVADLHRHGAKAGLARVLGVHRQTINTWLTSGTRMPDAERTLQLLAWLLDRRRGREPV